jgi:hypothetical protein
LSGYAGVWGAGENAGLEGRTVGAGALLKGAELLSFLLPNSLLKRSDLPAAMLFLQDL